MKATVNKTGGVVMIIASFLLEVLHKIEAFPGRMADNPCGMYLAPSTIPGAGRGIIAGVDYRIGNIVEIAPSTAFVADLMLDYSELNNYVYTYDEDYSMMLFGAGSLFNHNKRSTVKHYWIVHADNLNHPSKYEWTPFNTGNDVYIRATAPIAAGEEMYAYYGEHWFSQRDLPEIDLIQNSAPTVVVPQEQLYKYGHCLTDVGVGESHIVFAGKGLFARRAFKAGEIVVIAPMIALSRDVVDMTIDSPSLINFCFTLPNNVTEVVLFPLNNAAMINHQPADSANLALDWYDWSSLPSKGTYFESANGNALSLRERLSLSVKDLLASPFGQLDLSFTALRDIAEGEELYIDYGDMWGSRWNEYVEEMQAWQAEQEMQKELLRGGNGSALNESSTNASGISDDSHDELEVVEETEVDTSTMPRFRSYIELPDKLMPAHWLRQ